LKVPPLQADACPGARLEGPDQGNTFFHQQLGRIGPLAVETLLGHKNKDRHQDNHSPDDDPGGNPDPEFSMDMILPVFHQPPVTKAKVGIDWILIIQLDTIIGYLLSSLFLSGQAPARKKICYKVNII
jgi:hypothetical protein